MKTPNVANGAFGGAGLKFAYYQQQEIQNGLMRNRRRSLNTRKNGNLYKSMFDLASDISVMKEPLNEDRQQRNMSNFNSNPKEKNTKNNSKTSRDSFYGTSAIPAWKLKKALRAFKMVKLNEVELEFGSPHVQYFLASLCDRSPTTQQQKQPSVSNGLRARCPLVAEVRTVVSKLKSSEPVNAQGYQLSVAVAVLKVMMTIRKLLGFFLVPLEFLNGIPGGVFNELANEFYEISLQSTLDITVMYLHSIIHELPYVVQQFTYLLCKALRNLVRLTGGHSVENYTDLLMHFTPVLFPTALGDVDRFLRAARLLLVMVDHNERVFLPLPWLDGDGNWCWHNGDFEEESFVRSILNSLQNLEATLACDDSGVESELDDTSSAKSELFDDFAIGSEQIPFRSSMTHAFSLPDLYRFAYLEESDDQTNVPSNEPQ